MAFKNIKSILVPLDGSKNSFRGLDFAINIARCSQATITGLYVTPLNPPPSKKQIGYIRTYLLKNADKFMEKAKNRCAQNGILFHKKMFYGNEGPKIVKFAQNQKSDLIVIGSRGMSIIKEMFLGSTSNYVIHKSKTPVVIVK